MTDAWAREAARNNAEWCNAVFRSHGRPGRFEDAVWFNPHMTLRFYSNAITLSGHPRSPEQLRCVQDLLTAGLPGAWTVKDSFCAFDLTALGFRVLFHAEWIYRPRALPKPDAGRTGVRWARVEHAVDLARWAHAWDRAWHAQGTRVFLPRLLAEDDHAVIAGYRGDDIVAGCIASRSAGVVGVSNIFVPKQEALTLRAECLAAVMDLVPGLPVVGYERGDGLAVARALGFEVVGPLRIWTRDLGAGEGP